MQISQQDPISGLLAFLEGRTALEQLRFWRNFKTTHTRRIARTEAQLCPELLRAVDAQIENLKRLMAQGA